MSTQKTLHTLLRDAATPGEENLLHLFDIVEICNPAIFQQVDECWRAINELHQLVVSKPVDQITVAELVTICTPAEKQTSDEIVCLLCNGSFRRDDIGLHQFFKHREYCPPKNGTDPRRHPSARRLKDIA